MRRQSFRVGLAAFAFGSVCGIISASAAPATWVSGTGTDSGSCPVTSPCKTFAYALTQTAANGIISVLSPGNFGPVTINKSVNIIADAVEGAAINAAAGMPAINISAGADIVVLRGLTLSGSPAIRHQAGRTLHIEKCQITRSAGGIRIEPVDGITHVFISDTLVTDTSSVAIWISPADTARVNAMLDRVRVENSGIGLLTNLGNPSNITRTVVRDSVFAGNAQHGVLVLSGGFKNTVMIERSALLNNATGLEANSATVRLGDSAVSGNTNGVVGTIASYGNNKIGGNDVNGATSSISLK